MRPLSTARLRGPYALFLFLTAGLLPACGGGDATGVDGEDGEPAQLTFVTQPSDATAGEPISPAVEVEIQDESGNTDIDSSADVTVALENNPGGTTLQGTTTVTASAGVATFTDLSVEAAASGYTLEARATGIGVTESEPFQVTAAFATELVFRSQPSDTEGQEPISPAVEVAVRDEFGNTATDFTPNITVALATDPTGGDVTLSGTTTVSASDGVATFDDLSLDLPADGFTVEAAASDLPAVTSDPFAVHLTFVQVSSGNRHTCGVTTADHAYCWGSNGVGQLGDGNEGTDSDVPVPVSGGLTFARVSAGAGHTCGVTTADEAFCWGSNGNGELGDGTTTGSSTPVAVDVSSLSTQTFARVSAGEDHTCGVTAADEVFCWGNNSSGELGDGTTDDRSTPVAVSTTESFAQVSAGGNHTCGVTTADEAFCWGNNANGQLGDGSTDDRLTPVAVDVSGLSTQTFAQVTAGLVHTCGVTTADEAFCWGRNQDGQLGNPDAGTKSEVPVAVDVSGLTTGTFAMVGAGDLHTCGVTSADEAFCWGDNEFGQLGDGTTGNDRAEPTAVSTMEAFAQVTGGEYHTCGLTTDEEVFCWGANNRGQLGDGTNTDSSTPVRVVQ